MSDTDQSTSDRRRDAERQRHRAHPHGGAAPPAVRLPAARPAPHRDPRRLRARRLRRLHRPRRRQADALLPHVRRVRAGPRHHDRRGARHAGRHGSRAAGVRRVPRAPVRLLHTGVRHDDHRVSSRRTPTPPRRRRARRSRATSAAAPATRTSARPSCAPPRSPANAPTAPPPTPPPPPTPHRRRDPRMTTRQFGQPVLRKEDPRLVTGNGRYLDDLGHTAYEAAFVRSPHAHARITDIDVEGALDVEGVVAIFTHEDLEGPAADRLPLLIPHPSIEAGPHRLRARQGRRQPRRRADRDGRRDRPLRRRGRRPAHRRLLRVPAPGRRHRDGARRREPRPRRRPRQRRGPPAPGGRRRRVGARLGAAHPHARPRDRAQRLHAHGGQGRSRTLGLGRAAAAAALLDPDLHRRARRRRRQARSCRWPRSSASPPTWVAASASRSCTPGPRRSSSPGPRAASTTTSSGPRTGASTSPPAPTSAARSSRSPSAFDDDGRLPRGRREVLARQRRLPPLRRHRPDHHRDPAARPLQAAELPRRVLVALHQHRDRHALPRRRTTAGLLRHGADDGRDRRRARPRPGGGALAQLHPARGDALRPGADVPGRPAAQVRLRRLPRLARQAQGARGVGRLRGLPRGGARPRDARSASASAATSRAPASAPTRAATSTSRRAAGSTSPPASPPRARGTRRSSRRSSPTSSASRSTTCTSPPVTRDGCRMPWGRSRRAAPS